MRIGSKACSKNGHRERRSHHTDKRVEQHSAEVHRLCEACEVEMGCLESVLGHRGTEKRDETIRGDGWHAARRYERREGDLGRRIEHGNIATNTDMSVTCQ
jgi:hypothetical protein